MAYHCANLLYGQLERAVANEQYCSPLTDLLGRHGCTLASSNRPSNATPQDLTERPNALRESCVPDAKIGSAGLRYDNIILLNPIPYSWPEPSMSNNA